MGGVSPSHLFVINLTLAETGHCISGPIVLAGHGHVRDDGKHILVKFATFAVVWDIEMGEEQFQVKGSNFAFIHSS